MELMKRNEVNIQDTWDITHIYESVDMWERDIELLKQKTYDFADSYGKYLNTIEAFKSALSDLNEIMSILSRVQHYGELLISTDATDADNVRLSRKSEDVFTFVTSKISFFYSSIRDLSDEDLDKISSEMKGYRGFIRGIKRTKKIKLGAEAEQVLATLSPVFNSHENIYQMARICDMDFGEFEADGKKYPLSFSLYEDDYMYSADKAVRRAAFEKFSSVLDRYKNTIAEVYYSRVKTEKMFSQLRGFDSVIDYLLYEQEVDRELFDRQIDIIMNKFAPVMRKYAKCLKEYIGLEEIRYSDLKIDIDRNYSMTVSIDEAENLVREAVEPLGDDYGNMIMKYRKERWVDFPLNLGKETGGFATMPAGVHPYVLMSWTDNLSGVYTLIHELGHCGQFILTDKNNSLLDSEPSLYLSEAPSTFNELLFTDMLIRRAEREGDRRLLGYAVSKLLSDTYFHNFVTHLLEAAYQREVYILIDKGEAFDAETLSEIKRDILKKFWGDTVVIDEGASLTWMRQRHYYMGLYSYTYSAGLTIATEAFLNIKSGSDEAREKWIEFLKVGGSMTPFEAAGIAGVDIRTDKPLLNTIDYLDKMCDKMIDIYLNEK